MEKRNFFLTSMIMVLFFIVLISVFKYYHPTHFAYNDRFIIGNTKEKIVDKYGPFYSTKSNIDGELICGIYMINDNTPEFVMSYDNSLFYEIYFENDFAVKVKLREGKTGG